MPAERGYQTEAIIVRKTNLGEADRILTLYSPDRGKIQAVAKGVRRPRSKLAGHLELLTHSQITLVHGRNLDTIIGSQTINSFMTLKNDLLLTSYGLYASELVNQFTVEDSGNPNLFQLFLNVLKQITEVSNKDLLLRYFELHLLRLAGYQPELRLCVQCHMELKPVVNAFCSSAGGILCPNCLRNQQVVLPITVDALKVLRFMLRNEFEVVNRLKMETRLSHELKVVLAGYIQYLLERDVKSVEWLDTLRDQIEKEAPVKSA